MTKKKKKNKLLYIALSLVIAIMLWMVALNEENPAVTRNMSNVNVSIQSKQSLTSKDLVLLNEEIEVDLKLKGPVLTVGTIKSDDFEIYIDVSDIDEAGEYNAAVKVSGLPYGAELSSISPANVPITVDDLVQVDMPISVNGTGSLDNGLAVFSMSSSVSTVTITGPQRVINTIDNVGATVNLNGITGDISLKQPIAAYTQAGVAVNDITFSEEETTIDILTGYQRDVDIAVSVQGKPASGYAISSFAANPNQVTVISRNEDLTSISVVVNLTGKEKEDTTLLAKYNIDEENIVIVDPPKINVTVAVDLIL
jgi:YbbR domain-containing protein